jgi:uncharacterized protein (TIGR00730 family)
MEKPISPKEIFLSARDDASIAEKAPQTPQSQSASYQLAYTDADFLYRDELLSVRVQLEVLKPDIILEENNIHSTVVIFGSSRIPEKANAEKSLQELEVLIKDRPNDSALIKKIKVAKRILRNSRFYDEARKLAQFITEDTQSDNTCDLVVVTGGGPGIMEGANRGAMEQGGKSIGLNIALPFEQYPNAYITPELCFQFHYFAIRKLHFMKRAKAMVALPGGFGTLDELFETLTLIQTKKIKQIPIVLLGSEYWTKLIDFEMLVEEGMIEEEDLSIFEIVDSAEDAWQAIKNYWNL